MIVDKTVCRRSTFFRKDTKKFELHAVLLQLNFENRKNINGVLNAVLLQQH